MDAYGIRVFGAFAVESAPRVMSDDDRRAVARAAVAHTPLGHALHGRRGFLAPSPPAANPASSPVFAVRADG